MKSYNGLFDSMLEHDEIVSAILEAAQRKRGRKIVQEKLAHIDASAEEIKQIILNGWTPEPHERGRICEGGHKKLRENIQKPQWWPEQVIHHLMVRQLKKIYLPRVYRYACGIVGKSDEMDLHFKSKPSENWEEWNKFKSPGRGALFCANTIKRWRNKYIKAHKRFYVLVLDIHHFYDELKLPILKSMLRKRIRDKRFLSLCDLVIDSASPGIPKGYYCSPWFSQIYLEGMDNYIQQELKPDYYLRYMDNLFLFSTNKRKLRRMRDAIAEYLHVNLSLELNRSAQVYRFEEVDKKTGKVRGRAIECLGFVIHRNRVTIRKNIIKRIRAKALRMHRRHRCTRHDAATMMSYKGWLAHTDTYNYFQKYIKPLVSMRYCRRRISTAAKKEAAKRAKLENCA